MHVPSFKSAFIWKWRIVKLLCSFLFRINTVQIICMLYVVWNGNGNSNNLINGEPDGEEVGPHLALFPPVLLHQSHHEGAAHLVFLRVVVLLTQTEAVLRIGPESVCRTFSKHFKASDLVLFIIIAVSTIKVQVLQYVVVFRNKRFSVRDSLTVWLCLQFYTWVVPAASGGAASHPAALVHRNGPLVDLIVF